MTPAAKARRRAITRLIEIHQLEFDDLLSEERAKLNISPRSTSTKAGPTHPSASPSPPANSTGGRISARCRNAVHSLCSGKAGLTTPCSCACHVKKPVLRRIK